MSNGNTERTLRIMAKELAEKFYEAKRSDAFRSKDTMTPAYMAVMCEDGVVREQRVMVPFQRAYPTAHHYAKAHWPHFYDLARKCAIGLLKQPEGRISTNLKDAIVKALVEDRDRQHLTGGAELLQVKMENMDGQGQR